MIALNRPKIYSHELTSNSAVFGFGGQYELTGGLRHEISGIVYDRPDIKSSTIFIAAGEISEMNYATRKAINKIKSYSDLDDNWDGYGAIIPENDVINSAINFLWQADEDGFEVYFVAPGPNGDIVVEFKKENLEAEIYFNADNSNQILIYDGDNCVVEGTLEENYEDLREAFTSYEEA